MAHKITILYFEKLPVNAEFIVNKLKQDKLNSDVQVVDTREKFSEAIEIHNPQLILVGEGNSDDSAGEILEHLKAAGIQIPCFVIAENPSVEHAVAVLKSGAADYFLRTNLERLPAAIQEILLNDRGEKERIDDSSSFSGKNLKYRRLFECAADAVMLMTPKGKVEYTSPAVQRLLGYSQVDSASFDLVDLIHPKDVQVVSQLLIKSLENPGVLIGNKTGRIKHKNETWVRVELACTNLLNDPDVKGILTHFKHISERKRTEQSAVQNEEKYRALFRNSPDAILITTPDGEIFSANPAACEIFQRNEQELRNNGDAGIIDKRDQGKASFTKGKQFDGRSSGEFNLIRKDGHTFPAEVTSVDFEDEIGELNSYLMIRDISEKKGLEEKLKTVQNNYRVLFEHSPLPNWIYDVETFRILDVNKAAVENYGYSREEFLQLGLWDLRPEKEIPKLLENLKNISHDKGIADFGKIIHQKKDGSLINVEVYGFGLKFQGKKCRFIMSVDVTEKESVINKLREKSNRLLTAERIAKLGYWEIGLQQRYFYWSDEVYRIWGRKKELFQVDLDVFETTIHPDDLEGLRKEQEKGLTGTKDLDYKHRIIMPDGSIKWVHEKGKLIRDSQGVPLRFEGSVQDITEQKINSHKLMVSEARHRAILKSQTNYLTRISLEGKYSYVNDKFISDFSWIFPDKQLVGKGAQLTVWEYHHQRVVEVFKECVANPNKVYQVEMDKLKQDGGVTNTWWDFICLTDDAGKPLEVQGVGIDISDRVKAEQSLKESVTRYELVSKATSDAIWDWDYKTGKLYWGGGFETLFGYKSGTMTTDTNIWEKYLHPQDREGVLEDLSFSLAGTKKNWQAEYRFRKADGSYAFVVDKGFIIRDDSNKAIRMVGAMQDVTEKRKLEQLLDNATSLSKIGSFEVDLVNNRLFWSSMTKKIHEAPSDFDPSFEQAFSFYKEGESRHSIRKAHLEAVEKNISFDLELQIITLGGKEIWVRVIGQPEFENGKCVCINGSFQDIDKTKRLRLEAQKASEEKEIILESIGDAFFALDNKEDVVYWNKKAEELLDYSRSEVVGKKWWNVFPDYITTSFSDQYQKAVAGNSVQHFESYFERIEKWLEVTAYPSSNGLSVYFQDISERKNAELQILKLNKDLKNQTRELVTANKGMEQFSFIVSHNLRSPVANIMGLGDLIGQEDYPREMRDQLLKELLNNVTRLDHVIRDLNDILQVKVDSNAKKEPVHLTNLVESIKVSTGYLMKKENVEISTNFKEVVEIHTLQGYLYSIFYNLIMNSIKYHKPGIPPKISIRSEKKPGAVILYFKDNGLGIDLAKKGNQVFGLYKRFHDHVEGKGMGLFMVKTQVEMLGGKISINSEVNKGTEFIIELKEQNLDFANEDEYTISLHNR